MSKRGIFDRDGYIKLAPKVGDEPYHPTRKSDPQAEIELCTHCKKRECKYGSCRQIAKMKREMKGDTKNG